MKEIISKELLSEVLQCNCIKISSDKAYPFVEGSVYFWVEGSFTYSSVNIYVLAHKCKEKAREYGYSITTGNRVDGTDRYDVLCIHKDEDIECGEAVFFNEIVDTEPNGVFMAMQWILNNKDK